MTCHGSAYERLAGGEGSAADGLTGAGVADIGGHGSETTNEPQRTTDRDVTVDRLNGEGCARNKGGLGALRGPRHEFDLAIWFHVENDVC